MVKFRKTVHESENLTVIKVDGDFLVEDILPAVEEFYTAECTQKLLWDLRGADVSSLTAGDMKSIIDCAKQHSHKRTSGMTAFVVSDSVGFGLARMYQTYSEIKDLSVEHRVFESMDEAMEWFDQNGR